MTLDSWLVARLAVELDGALKHARVQSVTGDERSLVVECFRRGARVDLRVALDPDAPLIALTQAGESRSRSERGWLHGVAALLRNAVVECVSALAGDRVLFFDIRGRSAFGIEARHRIAVELEPRKSNVLVLKTTDGDDWQIIAAAKQFEGAEGGRAVRVGQPYETPPARHAELTPEAFGAAVAAQGDDAGARSVVRLLGMVDPFCTPPLARELLALADEPEAALRRWPELKAAVTAAAATADAPVFVALRGDAITACHVVPLASAGATLSRPSLLAVCAAALDAAQRKHRAPAVGALRQRVERIAGKTDEEAASITRALAAANDADVLRIAGNAIYAGLAQIEPRAESFAAAEGTVVKLDPRLSAKQNAARYFQRYKKARAGVPHMRRRLQQLRARREFADYVLWELDRAQSSEPDEARVIIADVKAALSAAGMTPAKRVAPAKRGTVEKKSTLVPVIRYDDGSAIYVGRSPKDNERVTFAIAGPDDWWFHARGSPGAHVVLKQAGSRGAPADDRIHAAAVLAAKHSRGENATRVEIDYTQRKHVRRQGGGRTGLVWYTNAKTIAVNPRA